MLYYIPKLFFIHNHVYQKQFIDQNRLIQTITNLPIISIDGVEQRLLNDTLGLKPAIIYGGVYQVKQPFLFATLGQETRKIVSDLEETPKLIKFTYFNLNTSAHAAIDVQILVKGSQTYLHNPTHIFPITFP